MKACLNLIENISECLALHQKVKLLFRCSVFSSKKRSTLREVVLEYINRASKIAISYIGKLAKGLGKEIHIELR